MCFCIEQKTAQVKIVNGTLLGIAVVTVIYNKAVAFLGFWNSGQGVDRRKREGRAAETAKEDGCGRWNPLPLGVRSGEPLPRKFFE